MIAKSKHAMAEFEILKEEFLQDVTTVEMDEIPPGLVLKWDRAGLKSVPSNTWAMEEQGLKRVDVAGANDKWQITAIFVILWSEIFCLSRSFTRVKPHSAILSLNICLTGTSHSLIH